MPKLKLVGLRLTREADPVPLKVTDCGLPGALSAIVSKAARAPAAAGVKVTLIVQLLPPATELAQVLVWAKSVALIPVIAMLVVARAAFPVLVRVTDCAELVLPRFWLVKVKLLALRLTTGPLPVPLKVTD